MTKYKWGILAACLLAVGAIAGPVKVWSSGEYINSADLNATVSHLHGNLGHGHGPVVVNADVSTSAAIAHSKLATPALLPKAWISLTATCTAGTCADVDKSIATSVAFVSTGVYTVSFPTRGDASYGALVTAYGNRLINCGVTAKAATTATVTCVTGTTGAETNGAFTFVLMDT
ncbi:MAG: hypothetical protein ACYCZR_03435 [Burkholderiales bacterium]